MQSASDPLRLLSAVAGICGLLFSILRVTDEVKKALDAAGIARQSRSTTFYELWFWAFISAVVGGFAWALIWRQSIGGTGKEPHGIHAVVWAVSVALPIVVALFVVNWKYKILQPLSLAGPVILWALGSGLGASAFYDLPIAHTRGFRDAVLASATPYTEFWLVLSWSTIIAAPAFIGFAIGGWLSTPRTNRPRMLRTLILPFIVVVVVTTLAVACFLLVYGDQTRFEQARGVVAALFFRMSMFIALFLALLAVREGLTSTVPAEAGA